MTRTSTAMARSIGGGRPKVAFIVPSRDRSGGARSIVVLANLLLDRGYRVRLLCPKASGSPRDFARRLVLGAAYRARADWLTTFHGEVEVFSHAAGCRFEPDEAIVMVGVETAGLAAELRHLPNPKLQYILGLVPWNDPLTLRALAQPYPKAFVSSYMLDAVPSCGGPVIGVVPPGVDPLEYFPSVPESERDGVGMIYGSQPAKDPATALAVVGELSARLPGVPVRCFGADRRPRELFRRSYVRFPTVAQARELYSRSAVWIVPSRSEGFGMPVLEAMACGCAVAATDCGGPRDIITDGENGFLVPVGGVNAMVETVSRLLSDARLRRRIVGNSRRTVAHFSWTRMADRFEEVLAGLGRVRPAAAPEAEVPAAPVP